MALKFTLKSLLSETRKMIKNGSQRLDYVKDDLYRHLSQSYSKLSQADRYAYLRELSYMHDYNKEKLLNIKIQDTTSDALRIRRMYTIKESLQPKYREFFINLGRVPDGIKLLVDLRSDIIDIQRMIDSSSGQETTIDNDMYSTSTKSPPGTAEVDENASINSVLRNLSSPENMSNLYVLNAELKDLINVWFSGGFCLLERVTWDSSCYLLERISELEAVHPIRSWTDIKRRVGAYRRCYVFTHPCMPKEPIVILHTALLEEIPSSIKEVVQKRFPKENMLLEEPEDPSKIQTAIFYSISSPHTGLNGIDLGNALIKRVVQTLLFEFNGIKQFSTLSPIPGFRRWLDSQLQRCLNQEINSRIIDKEGQEQLDPCNIITSTEMQVLSKYFNTTNMKDLLSHLKILLENISMNFSSSKSLVEQGQSLDNDYILLLWFLKSMAAKYLCNEKRRGYALDSVCNFHLKNGAVIWRINWLADSSVRGVQNSYGVMVNYRYYIEHNETYSQQYMEHKTIEMSDDVKELLAGSSMPNFETYPTTY